ncbi:FBP domain-containing protein [Streptomyces sp. OfavH-34-F]|uniref:FBP domain-containing protein n=1 Tax=unclassified Streptomyces TaxID=2593676 RepID=UPI001EF2E520|nr:FBP domain-containing protein [Streptomyces sp. OfavH-34-F]MCG7526686.1 FBP domain-containing protein [Streptomyces sp. OfavH-34-F]
MKAVTEQDIRSSFVNCSKGEAKRLPMPRNFEELPWDDLDFLGWRDLSAPGRSYIVAEHEGELTGISLRFPSQQRGFLHRSMCSLCLTTHPGNGVSLMTARKAGPSGREGNSVGLYICTDLACSLYVRGKKTPASGARFKESLTTEEQIARTLTNLHAFVAKLHH